jgi:uncharacterized membrane protein YczE
VRPRIDVSNGTPECRSASAARPDTGAVHAPGHRQLTDRLVDRAWSRAGAVARVVASGPTRRALALGTRVTLMLAGAVAVGCAVAVMLWDRMGPGPLDVLIVAIRDHTGLELAPAMWLTVGALIVVAWLLGRRPGAGTLLAPFLIGPVAQLVLGRLDSIAPPGSILVRALFHVAAIGVAGLGAGALIVSGLGAGMGELLAAAASDRSGQSEPRVRFAFEASFVVLGVLLGGPFGLGTVLVVTFIGPAVALGYRLVDRAAAHVRSRVLGPPEPAVVLAS